MSTLIVELPPRPRLTALRAEPLASPDDAELFYAFSADGVQLSQQGRAAPAALPPAQRLVLVLAPTDIGWHRLTAPKAPANRLRQALLGMLEESLLQDEDKLHLAIAPQWKAGESHWVATVDKPWLQAQIGQLEALGLTVDAVVPGWAPEGAVAGHVLRLDDRPHLAWRDADGPLCLPLDSPLAPALVAAVPEGSPVDWSACPDSAEAATQLAGWPVAAQNPAERLLAAARGPWNLRQFDLAARHRSDRALREAWRQFAREPAWRPVRLGLLALLLLQVLGSSLWAWQQHQSLKTQRQRMEQLLRSSFPGVRAIIDAPAQMGKELERLRMSAGRPGEADLEPMLQAAQASWPATRGPADGLRFEPGRLTLDAAGWASKEHDELRQRLLPLGYALEASPTTLVLTPAPGGPQPGGLPATAAPTATPATAPAVPAASTSPALPATPVPTTPPPQSAVPPPQPLPPPAPPSVNRPAAAPVMAPPQRPSFMVPPPPAGDPMPTDPGANGPGIPANGPRLVRSRGESQ